METSQRTGTIKCWYKGEGGYGYIAPDYGDEDLFVHHTAIAPYARARSLKKGVRVTYDVTQRKMGGMWAKDVCTAD